MAKASVGTKRGGKKGKGVAWKQSKFLALGLVAVIVAVWIWLGLRMLGGDSSGSAYVIKDFPFTFIAEGGTEPFVQVADTSKPPRIPFKNAEGKLCWEAWICENAQCPGKKGGKQYLYANIIPYIKKMIDEGKWDLEKGMPVGGSAEGPDGMPPQMMMMFMNECPACKKARKDAFKVKRFQTPEGEQKLEELRKKVQEESKKSGG